MLAVRMVSKPLRHAAEKAAARAELRGEDADAGAVAQLIDVIEHVDDVEAQRQRLHAGYWHFLREPEINLRVRRHVLGVGEARAQSAAIDHINAEPCAVPLI